LHLSASRVQARGKRGKEGGGRRILPVQRDADMPIYLSPGERKKGRKIVRREGQEKKEDQNSWLVPSLSKKQAPWPSFFLRTRERREEGKGTTWGKGDEKRKGGAIFLVHAGLRKKTWPYDRVYRAGKKEKREGKTLLEKKEKTRKGGGRPKPALLQVVVLGGGRSNTKGEERKKHRKRKGKKKAQGWTDLPLEPILDGGKAVARMRLLRGQKREKKGKKRGPGKEARPDVRAYTSRRKTSTTPREKKDHPRGESGKKKKKKKGREQ